MTLTITRALTALIIIFCGALLAFAPQLSPSGVVFGARVPRAKLGDATVTSATRTYRLTVMVVTLAVAVLAVVFSAHPGVIVAAPLLLVVAAGAAYASQHKRIAEAKKAGRWFEGVPTAVTGRIAATDERSIRVPWELYLAALVMTALGALYIASRWADIPEVVPTHFDVTFTPDSWANKSVGSAFTGIFVALGLTVLFVGLSWVFAQDSVHARSDRSASGKATERAVTAESLTGMGVLAAVMAGGLSLIQSSMLFDDLAPRRPAIFVGFLVVLLGAAAVMVARTIIVRRRFVPEEGEPESPDNDHFYLWGMFYCNPDDPAVLVDKRAGVGANFNYATWQGKLFAVVSLVLLAAAVALPFAL